jgi:transcriptional regulator with XRE-family HTH domain
MEALGVSDAAVYQWESGANTPRVKTLPKIAKLYGCTIEELLDDDEQ